MNLERCWEQTAGGGEPLVACATVQCIRAVSRGATCWRLDVLAGSFLWIKGTPMVVWW